MNILIFRFVKLRNNSCILPAEFNVSLIMLRIFTTVLISLFFVGNVYSQGSRDHITVGYGLGMIYADNAGLYKSFDFKMRPAFTLAYSKELSERFDFRTSFGGQFISSGEFRSLNSPIIVEWGNNGQAYFFDGNAFFLDVMPVLQLNPNKSGRAGEPVNLYMGLGIGGLYSQRAQRVLRDGVLENGIFVEGFVERSNQTLTTAYIPFKFGLSTNFEYEWDMGFEINIMTILSSDIDGNNMINKLFYPDVMVNMQLMVRRYLRR